MWPSLKITAIFFHTLHFISGYINCLAQNFPFHVLPAIFFKNFKTYTFDPEESLIWFLSIPETQSELYQPKSTFFFLRSLIQHLPASTSFFTCLFLHLIQHLFSVLFGTSTCSNGDSGLCFLSQPCIHSQFFQLASLILLSARLINSQPWMTSTSCFPCLLNLILFYFWVYRVFSIFPNIENLHRNWALAINLEILFPFISQHHHEIPLF